MGSPTRVLVTSLGCSLAVVALTANPADARGRSTNVNSGSGQAVAPAAGTYSIRALNNPGRGELKVFSQDGALLNTINPDAAGLYQVTGAPGSTVMLSVGVGVAGGPSEQLVKVLLPAESLRGEITANFKPAGSDELRPDTRTVGGPDSCTPTVIAALPYLDGGSTVGATATGGLDAACTPGASAGAPDVWYSYTNSTALPQNITVSLCGSAYDTVVSVFEVCNGSCAPGDLLCVTAIDDFCGLQSQVAFTAGPGDISLIRVSGFAGQSGTYTMNVTLSGAGGNNPICPIPMGACCLTGPGAPLNCAADITEADCTLAGGSWTTEGEACSTDLSARFATDVPSVGFGGPGQPASADAHITYTAPADCCAITDLDALFHIHHTFNGDLQVDLTGNGITTRHWGGACGTPNLHFVADDTGQNPAATLCTSLTPDPPSESFADYIHIDTDGPPPIFGSIGGMQNYEGGNTCTGGTATQTWLLHVNDTFTLGDGGTIEGFGLLAAGCGEIIQACPVTPCAAGGPGSGAVSTP